MLSRFSTSRACWFLSCVFLAATWTANARADEAIQSQVTVESWVVEVSLADKSRHIGATTLGDLFKSRNPPALTSLAELGITPTQLISDLESQKLGRAITTARLKLPSGQQGSLHANGTEIETTATANGDKVCLDYRVAFIEEDPKLRDSVTGKPGYRQRTAHMAFEIESGKAVMLPALPDPEKPHKTIAFFLQATIAAAPQPQANAAKQPAAASEHRAEGPAAAKSPAPLAVDLKVMQIEVAKLKRLGFAWSQLGAKGETATKVESGRTLLESKMAPDQLAGFIEALRHNSLARVIAEPTLVTLDGRPASFIAGGTHLDIVPILLGNGRVGLECRTEITEPAHTSDHVRLDVAAEMELGQMRPLGFIRANLPTAGGKQEERELIVLAKVQRWEPGGQTPVREDRTSHVELPAKRR